MVDQKIVDWVKGELAKGRQPQEVSGDLLKAGWKQADVDAALSATKPQISPVRVSQPVGPAEPEPVVEEVAKSQFTTMHMVIIIVVCVLILIGLAVYKFFNP